MTKDVYIREAKPKEYVVLSKLVTQVYSGLEGFPSVEANPDYYQTFSNFDDLAKQDETKVIVAISDNEEIVGGILFYGNAINYGSGIIDTNLARTSGIRLLVVKQEARKKGIGKALTEDCISRTLKLKHTTLILHTTKAMQVAWDMYVSMGFKRFEQLDFQLNGMTVYGLKKLLL